MTSLICPDCGTALMRIRRRPSDRVISVLCEVHRYRCTNSGCLWEGILRQEPEKRWTTHRKIIEETFVALRQKIKVLTQ